MGIVTMKKLLLAAALALAPLAAHAQCTGVFQPGTLCGNDKVTAAPPHQVPASAVTGPGTTTINDLVLWNSVNGTNTKDQAPQPLTGVNDTNVTVTVGGSSAISLVNPASLTLGWTGTLAAGRLNSNVVQSVVNDTNVTGAIAGQALTLAWTGTLAAARLNSNVVQAFTNDTNVTASITAQNATLAWAGQLAIARGGTGAATAQAAATAILPLINRAGDVIYWNGSNWVTLAGNNSGTQFLQENASGVPSWATVAGTGTVTNAVIVGAGITVNSGTCTITTTGTCTLTTTAAQKVDQLGTTSISIAVVPGVQQFHPSAVKAWANYVCAASPTINASYNVTSITRNGTGDCTINFTTSFANANYVCSYMALQASGTVGVFGVMTSQSAGAARVVTFNTGGVQGDAVAAQVQCTGTQ
jgi:hypothetical protein